MPRPLNRGEVYSLIGEGSQLVEVLPPAEYEAEHLPDARNVPLKALTRESARTLDAARPVIVYCWDAL